MKRKCFLVFFLLLFADLCFSQQLIYKEYDLDGNKDFLSSIELSPDGRIIAIGTGNGHIFFWDIASKKIVRKFDLSGFSWGPYMTYSSDGRYLLLQEQFYTDFSINKDHPNTACVMDVSSGTILLSKDHVHSACLTPDSKSLITLQDDEVIFWNIQSGVEERKFKPENVTNSIAINKAGDIIAVSAKITEGDVKSFSSIRDDKKAVKEALKFREIAVFYDANTFAKKYVANDIFDIVFSMNFSLDGKSLYLFNAPNLKFRSHSGAGRNGYIQVVNAADGNVSRTIFSSNAAEPIYKESADGKYFAVTSIEQKFAVYNSVVVFERETGYIYKNFVNDFRIFENTHNGRACFEFLPDHTTIAIGYGSKMALWEFEK